MGSRLALVLGGRRDFYVASPETVTPTLGIELVTNGNMETGDPPTGWTDHINGGAVVTRAAEERTGGSGSACANVESGIDGSDSAAYKPNYTVAGRFHRLSHWIKNIDAVVGKAKMWAANLGAWSQNVSAVIWTEVKYTFLALDAQTRTYILTNGALGTDSRHDDVSLKEISPASMLGDVCEGAREGHFVTAWPTVPTDGNVVGMSICLDDESNPQNEVKVWHDGTNVTLGKWVGGTYTEVQAATAAAWSNGAELEIKKFGTAFTVSYNGVVVGTVQTISDVGVIGNVKCAWFTTDGALKPSYWRHF